MCLPRLIVHLVGDQHNTIEQIPLSQQIHHNMIQWEQAVGGVDHQQDHRGRLHCSTNLPLDVLCQGRQITPSIIDPLLIGGVDTPAARISELHPPCFGVMVILRWLKFDDRADPITGHTRYSVDNGNPTSDKAVEQTRLAHIGPAYDGDLR